MVGSAESENPLEGVEQLDSTAAVVVQVVDILGMDGVVDYGVDDEPQRVVDYGVDDEPQRERELGLVFLQLFLFVFELLELLEWELVLERLIKERQALPF